MNYAEAVTQHADAHPYLVERYSAITGRWLYVNERKTRESAERLVEHWRIIPAYAQAEYRITDRSTLTVHDHPAWSHEAAYGPCQVATLPLGTRTDR